jgi:hypothetical protein
MNNTKRNLSAISAILAVTLVVGGMLAAISSSTTTQSASAYPQKKVAHDKGKHNGRGIGNTDTNQICNNNSYASGLDPQVNENCEPQICTHPNNDSACSEEGVTSAITAAGNNTIPVKLSCEQCFTKFLSGKQITDILTHTGSTSLAQLCASFPGDITLDEFARVLRDAGVDNLVIVRLIECMLNAGVVFAG